jgi:hypothetical protein
MLPPYLYGADFSDRSSPQFDSQFLESNKIFCHIVYTWKRPLSVVKMDGDLT